MSSVRDGLVPVQRRIRKVLYSVAADGVMKFRAAVLRRDSMEVCSGESCSRVCHTDVICGIWKMSVTH